MGSVHGAPQAVSSPRTALMHTSSLGSLVSQSPSYTSPVMGTYCSRYLPFPLNLFSSFLSWFFCSHFSGMYFDQVDNEKQPTR